VHSSANKSFKTSIRIRILIHDSNAELQVSPKNLNENLYNKILETNISKYIRL